LPQFTTEIRSAGVDTLTCSAERDKSGSHLLELARQLQLAEARHGSKLSPFKRAVYSGVQSAHVAWGEQKDRVLVELRGRWAHDWWNSVLPLASKVSRLDVQVSVFQEPYDHDMALRLYLGDRKRAEQRGRPSQFRYQGEADGGSTLYIGKGASRYQGRLYERYFKSHQEDELNVWRYEVQCRRERARQVADLIRGTEDVRPFLSGLVHQHFARRGVVPIFDPQTDVSVAPLPEAETDSHKSLNWLASSVRPALARHEAWGTHEQAIRALGIEPTGEHL
jgi:DNA relaxase NicK